MNEMPFDSSEAAWEADAMDTLGELAWMPVRGQQIAPGTGERSWSELVLTARLEAAIARINPQLPPSAVEEATTRVLTAHSRDALAENRRIHDHLTKGIRSVVYTDEFGAEQNPTIRIVDFEDVESNDFMAASQVMIVDGEHRRRFDIVLFLNGLPVGLIEVKKADDERADLEGAHAQIQTYVEEFPLAFAANVVCMVTDGVTARYGTAFTPFEHFAPWNVDEKGDPVRQPPARSEDLAMNLALHGVFEQVRFLEILRGFVAFDVTDDGPRKRIAKAHQYFAVKTAVDKTLEAVRRDGKAGVVWHTQGSGKSMEMELYAHQVSTHPALGNPTIVVITDRVDLDDQLYSVFQISELLPEPVQVATKDELRSQLINRRTGGIIFTTLQKFGLTTEERDAGRSHPLLTDRRNIVVIVDEAHRSHYDNLDGYARHLRDALPYATLIAFTGTPVSEADRNTRDVFGPYIDVYDLTRSINDESTVPIYHESRLVKIDLPEDLDPEIIDERADEATAGLDEAEAERVRRAVAVMNEIYGAPDRLRTLAADLVQHWEARSGQMRKFIACAGKGMIVCATRDICARLYEEIIALRPEWHADADDKGLIKVVYTGNPSDPGELRKHVRRPSQNKAIQQRAKDEDDELELVIVQSMWLTGFDSPPLHTLYVDRPMRGAALMQAIARVNRRFRGKQDGLLVGYAPLTENLHAALAEYTVDDRAERPMGRPTDEALSAVRDLHAVLCGILSGYDWRAVLASRSRTAHKDALLGAVNYLRTPTAPGNLVEHGEEDLGQRFRKNAARLERLFALCASSGELNELRDDIAFFAAVRVWMAKFDAEDRRSRGLPIPAEVALYLKQLAAGAVEAGGVTDIYDAAGIPRPDLSHLDETYIERLRQTKTPNLAIEALRRAIEQTMRHATRHNIVRQQSFSDRLIDLVRRYTNQQLSFAEIIAELVAVAREVSADAGRGAAFDPPLSEAELAFYDAVSQNESAVEELGSGVLAVIARDLVRAVRADLTVDWVSREDVRAKMRTTIKRLLAKYGYPPDAEPEATQLVIRQMETFAEDWSPDA